MPFGALLMGNNGDRGLEGSLEHCMEDGNGAKCGQRERIDRRDTTRNGREDYAAILALCVFVKPTVTKPLPFPLGFAGKRVGIQLTFELKHWETCFD